MDQQKRRYNAGFAKYGPCCWLLPQGLYDVTAAGIRCCAADTAAASEPLEYAVSCASREPRRSLTAGIRPVASLENTCIAQRVSGYCQQARLGREGLITACTTSCASCLTPCTCADPMPWSITTSSSSFHLTNSQKIYRSLSALLLGVCAYIPLAPVANNDADQ